MVMTFMSFIRKPIKSVLLMGMSFPDPPSAQQKHSVLTICHGSAWECMGVPYFFVTGKDLGFDVTFPKSLVTGKSLSLGGPYSRPKFCPFF